MRSLDGTKAVCIKGVFYYSEAVHFKYSEAWSIYLMHIELSKAIKNADIVLIGIGNEWKYDFSKMKTNKEYMQIIDHCRNGYEWLVPYIQYYYMQHNPEGYHIKEFQSIVQMLNGKDYFLVSTCAEKDPISGGFSQEKCVFPCGNYEYLQKIQDTDHNLIKAEESSAYIHLMAQIENLTEGVLAVEAIEKPCLSGEELIFNQKFERLSAENYNEAAYLDQWQKYMQWLSASMNHELLILELGVGLDYPTVIRWPFEKVALINNKAYMMRVNQRLYQITPEIKEKAVSVPENSVDYITQESLNYEIKE